MDEDAATMSEPWKIDGFPPLADRAFDLTIDEQSFAFIEDAVGRYGDVFGVRPETRTAATVVVNHPDHAWRVLGSNHSNYTKGVGMRRVRMLLGKGLIVNEGRSWRDRRRVLQPAFHAQAIANLSGVMADANRALLERWRAKAASGEPIDVTKDTARLTLEIIVRCLFGEDTEDLAAESGDIPFAFLADDMSRSLRTVHRLRQPREQVKRLIERRLGRGEQQHDLLGMLLAARHPETGEPMDSTSVCDEVATMVVAGHETSASALCWAWYLLSQHPEVEAELHREADALPSDPATTDDLRVLPATRRVLDETLRLYPPGWVLTRRAIDSDRFGPHCIPPGTDVLVSPYFLHRHPDYWSSPATFDPGRFTSAPRHKHAYIPFGAGPRRCIGDVFAMVEMQLHLGLMTRHVKLRYLGEGPPTPEPRVNLRPKEHLAFIAELRD